MIMADIIKCGEPDIISMGGTANLLNINELSGIGALTGTINGAGYGAPTGEMNDMGNGRMEFTGIHYFLDRDGSTLHTHDKAVIHVDPDGGPTTLEVEYTVVEASGRFEGYGGTFRSRGWLNGVRGVGVVRFEGAISRQ